MFYGSIRAALGTRTKNLLKIKFLSIGIKGHLGDEGDVQGVPELLFQKI